LYGLLPNSAGPGGGRLRRDAGEVIRGERKERRTHVWLISPLVVKMNHKGSIGGLHPKAQRRRP